MVPPGMNFAGVKVCRMSVRPRLTSAAQRTMRRMMGPASQRMQAMGGRSEDAMPEQAEVVLLMPTFTGAADMAGISRIMGGYHIEADNVEGLKLGRSVATFSWPKYEAYFNGVEQR